MTSKVKVFAVSTSMILVGVLFPVQSANALPSPFEKELQAATKVDFGKTVEMALPTCTYAMKNKKYVMNCKYEKFLVTINSFEFQRRYTPIDVEVSIYAIDMKLENYSKKRDSGLDVGALLRCKNQKNGSSFYSDSIDPQDIPAGSELSGIVYASLPDDLSAEACQMPTLWISLTNSAVDMKDKALVAAIKKKKLVSRAYIPLTPEMLAAK